MSEAEQRVFGGLYERVRRLMPRLSYKLAKTDAFREDIFRMRYGAYFREGNIPAAADGLFSDEADYASNTYLFGVHVDGALASSIRLSIATADEPDIPSGHAFPSEINAEIGTGKIIVDPTRFVVDHAKSKLHPELPYITLRLAWMAAEHFGADLLLAAVRVEHAAFYRRFWNAHRVTEARTYPHLSKPITLTMSDYHASRDLIEERYPLLASTAAERASLFGDHASPWRGGNWSVFSHERQWCAALT